MKTFLFLCLISLSAMAAPRIRVNTPLEIRIHKGAVLPDGKLLKVASFTKDPPMEGFKKSTVKVEIQVSKDKTEMVELNWVTSPQGQNKYSSAKAGPYVIQLLGMKYDKSILVTIFKM